MEWKVIGIDPAPKKKAAVWTDDGLHDPICPTKMREWIEEQIRIHERLLIAWDAPLTFDAADGFSMRPVERVIRKFLRKNTVAEGDKGTALMSKRIGKRAVSVQPFSGCSHWAITCHALGFPYGNSPDGLRMANVGPPAEHESGALLIEVHPAVSMAIDWLERDIPRPLPRYKGDSKACREIVDELEFPPKAAIAIDKLGADDTLDAYVAWKMGRDFLTGKAKWIGDPKSGGFVLPMAAMTQLGLS